VGDVVLLRCGVGGRAAQLVWFGISGGAADGETETTTTGSVSFSQGGMHCNLQRKRCARPCTVETRERWQHVIVVSSEQWEPLPMGGEEASFCTWVAAACSWNWGTDWRLAMSLGQSRANYPHRALWNYTLSGSAAQVTSLSQKKMANIRLFQFSLHYQACMIHRMPL
jgi:hypothetical protein